MTVEAASYVTWGGGGGTDWSAILWILLLNMLDWAATLHPDNFMRHESYLSEPAPVRGLATPTSHTAVCCTKLNSVAAPAAHKFFLNKL